METGHITFLLSVTMLMSSASLVTECGMKKSTSRIVGGRDSGGYHYPWFALLVLRENEDFPVCAGSLITDRHVLTAAHCFNIKPSTPKEELYNVLLGVYDRCNHEEPTRKKFGVSRVDIHEEYSSEEKFHDIAIMALDKPALFTTICLPLSGADDITEPAILIGFGVTKEGGRKAPCHMMEADIIKYSTKDCSYSDLPEDDINEPTVICAGRIGGGIDSCQGDSGGPLQTINSAGKYVIAGIVSYGYGCGNPGLPGLYTKVASYLDWINNKLTDSKSVVANKHAEFYNGSKGVVVMRQHSPESTVSFPDGAPQDTRTGSGNGILQDRNELKEKVHFPSNREITRASTVSFPKERR